MCNPRGWSVWPLTSMGSVISMSDLFIPRYCLFLWEHMVVRALTLCNTPTHTHSSIYLSRHIFKVCVSGYFVLAHRRRIHKVKFWVKLYPKSLSMSGCEQGEGWKGKVKWGVKNAVSKACLRTEEEADAHTLTHGCMHANTHAPAPPASRYAGDLVPFWIIMSLTCMMSRWLIPGEAAVIHAAHSGLSAAKDNGQNKAGERAAGRGSPRRSAALGPHSYLIGESPPPPTLPLHASRLHSNLGVGGLVGGSVGSGGDKALANIVFRKSL